MSNSNDLKERIFFCGEKGEKCYDEGNVILKELKGDLK